MGVWQTSKDWDLIKYKYLLSPKFSLTQNVAVLMLRLEQIRMTQENSFQNTDAMANCNCFEKVGLYWICSNFVFAQYLENKWTESDQILYKH